MLGALYRRGRLILLAADPGFRRACQAFETLAAVLLVVGLLRRFGRPVDLFGALAAGFVLQCVAGRTRGAELFGMALTGIAFVVLVALGAALGQHPILGPALIIGAAFLALRIRNFAPAPAFTLFPFVFFVVASASPSGAAAVRTEATATAAGIACALLVHALSYRPAPARAFADAVRVLCAGTATILRALGDIARGAEPGAARRCIDRQLLRIERSATRGAMLADAGPPDDEPGLADLIHDQHEALHVVIELRRIVEVTARRRPDHAAGALAVLIDRLADAFEAIDARARRDGPERARDDPGGVARAVDAVEASLSALPCASAVELGALASAAAGARRLEAIRARFAAELPRIARGSW